MKLEMKWTFRIKSDSTYIKYGFIRKNSHLISPPRFLYSYEIFMKSKKLLPRCLILILRYWKYQVTALQLYSHINIIRERKNKCAFKCFLLRLLYINIMLRKDVYSIQGVCLQGDLRTLTGAWYVKPCI